MTHEGETTALTEAEEQRYAELQLIALDYARNGDTEMLGYMLDAGLPANLADGKGNTLLMLAAYHGNDATARLLLEHGADPERMNARGQTPLAGVAFKGNVEMARILMGGGARADSPCRGGQTPLQFAALFGNKEMYRLLLACGGRDRLFGMSAARLVAVTSRLRKLLAPKTTPGNGGA